MYANSFHYDLKTSIQPRGLLLWIRFKMPACCFQCVMKEEMCRMKNEKHFCWRNFNRKCSVVKLPGHWKIFDFLECLVWQLWTSSNRYTRNSGHRFGCNCSFMLHQNFLWYRPALWHLESFVPTKRISASTIERFSMCFHFYSSSFLSVAVS